MVDENAPGRPGTTEQAARILGAWQANAGRWIRTVRSGAIASRRAGTDAAIVDAASSPAPGQVLDIGCGEGWLLRELAARTGCRGTGIDAVPELVAAAAAADPDGSYLSLDYAAFAADPGRVGAGFDLAVFNFALFEADPLPVLRAAASRLRPGGRLLLQTVHPWTAAADGGYRDSWQEEAFAAFGEKGWQPMPYFRRTLEGWSSILAAAGLVTERILEPGGGADRQPLSILFACRQQRSCRTVTRSSVGGQAGA